MARDQLLLQLDPYLQGRLENVSPLGIQGMQVDGKLYGIPESSKVVAIYYKKSLIGNPPATTDELLDLVRDGNLLVNFLGAYHLFGWANAFGGQLFDANNRCVAHLGGWDEALNYLLELKEAGAIFEPDFGVAENLFLRGGAAMLVNGSWVLEDYQKIFGENLGVISMPAGPQGPAGPFVGVDGFYVNRFSQNKEAAISLALFLTSQESGQVFADRGGHVPVHTGVTINDPLLLAFSQAVESGIIRPQSREFDNYWGPFGEMFFSVLDTGISPKDALENACDNMNQLNGK
jgi:arabinogalactan oligomer/maltooligosaccharide transport system substrate-binding protein